MFPYVISFLIILADQASKYFFLNLLQDGQSLPVVSNVFHLTLVRNPGIAFGLLSNFEGLLILIVMGCLGVIAFLLAKLPRDQTFERICLALILGGAIGNMIDRIRFGYVIDFLDFRVWPVFNLADSFITIGVGLFLLSSLKKKN